MTWTWRHEQLLAEIGRRCLASLPCYAGRNACLEVAALAAATARELGHSVTECVGWWQLSDAERIPHAWIEIDGLVIHSRAGFAGGYEIEMVAGGTSKVE